ncbi:MAG: biopolymer transporter ExbD [Deltaproteobacteria bacterium]|nr:biopolymer transporter ExbD [Deltaproteobacteria bacterium]
MELSAQRVRSKTRNAVRRREDQIEQEEIESGELNLIPYLDMVTNLMLFLLFSISAGIIFTQIDTTLPDKAPPSTNVAQQPTQPNPDDQPLKMVVSITKDKMILWSITGIEGTLPAPKAIFPRTGHDGDSCDGPYMCESGYCNNSLKCAQSPSVNNAPVPTPVYDYRALSAALFEIANRHYNGKIRKLETYQIILMADGTTPYATIASTMAAMRCKLADFDKEPKPCAIPTEDEESLKRMRAKKISVSPDNTVLDPETAPYDPNKMALFSTILFSSGFE